MPSVIEISREQRLKIHEMVSTGSNPRPTFFFFVALSTLIAAFGLLMDSTAVVIGAMLVAPLMTPILGLGLALVQGNSKLLGYALRAEIAGVAIAIAASYLLGMAIPYFDATAEMLSRTRPNLLDLLVALFAGAAGAYALVDEKLSPALPGVAISTAIVPPLANAGLCLSLGAYAGATGSFLLFFTNFLCILLVSAFIFWLSGMSRRAPEAKGRTFLRRFGPALVGLAVVTVFLGRAFGTLLEKRRLRNDVRQILSSEFSEYRVTNLKELSHWMDGETVQLLAHVHAPRMLTPRQVKAIEKKLESKLSMPFNLFLRTTLTRTISASGSVHQSLAHTLDGFAFADKRTPEGEILVKAEQIIREYLGEKMGQKLVELQSIRVGDTTVLFAEVTGLRRLRRAEVAAVGERVREQLGSDSIQLRVRQGDMEVMTGDGVARLEFGMRRPMTPEEQTNRKAVVAHVRTVIAEDGFSVISSSMTILDDGYHFLFEVAGPRQVTLRDLHALQSEVQQTFKIPARLYIRLVPDTVVSEQGFTSWGELLTTMGERVRETYEEETQELLDAWH